VNADCNSRLGRGVAYCVVKLIQDVENEPINLIKGEKEKDGRGGVVLLSVLHRDADGIE